MPISTLGKKPLFWTVDPGLTPVEYQWFWQKAQGVYIFWEGQGFRTVNLTRKMPTALMDSGVTWAVGPDGPRVSFPDDVGPNAIDLGSVAIWDSLMGGRDRLCLEAYAFYNGNSEAEDEGRLISLANGTAAADHFWMINDQRTDLRFRLKAGGSTSTLIPIFGTFPSNQQVHAFGNYDGVVMSVWSNFSSDTLVAMHEISTLAKTGNVDTGASNNPAVGNVNPGHNDSQTQFHGFIDVVVIYSDFLTGPEIAQRDMDPYGPFRPWFESFPAMFPPALAVPGVIPHRRIPHELLAR